MQWIKLMDKINGLSDFDINKIEQDFIGSLKKVRAIFGRHAFRKFTSRNGRRSPLNKALFEIWCVGVRDYDQDILVANKDRIIDDFVKLLSPVNLFSRSISSSTSSSWAVSTRFNAINNLLRENCK